MSEGYGQKAVDTKGPRNMSLGSTLYADAADPVWEAVNYHHTIRFLFFKSRLCKELTLTLMGNTL